MTYQKPSSFFLRCVIPLCQFAEMTHRETAKHSGKSKETDGTWNALVASMTIVNIERALRAGKTPEQLGATPLETGAQKVGYLITTTKGRKYVLKLNTGGWRDESQKRPPNLSKYGCATIYQTRAGQYIIQEFVTQLQTRNYKLNVPYTHPAWKILNNVRCNEQGDYHAANFGIREDGMLVCFDW